jgi:hypothetical protein
MTTQFDNPGSASALDLHGLIGKLLLLKPSHVEVGVKTVLGEKDATVADIHVVDGDEEPYIQTFVWPRVLQAQLRSTVGTGRWVLGRLGQGVAKPGQSPPWRLGDPTDDDRKLAAKYLEALAPTVSAPDNDAPPW